MLLPMYLADCNRLAADLHHVIYRSLGGADESDNLIGLCKACHQRLHTDRSLIFEEDLQEFLKPKDAAQHWLARQLTECPVRLDEVWRSELFQQLEAAVTSVDNMNYHAQAISDSNHWCSYEVFLKAAWTYLSEQGREQTTVGAVVLLKMVQLYRRRSGQLYKRAAARRLRQFRHLIEASSDKSNWLNGIILYEEAYMRFLANPSAQETEDMFVASFEAEKKCGRPLGELVSLAQGNVVILRRASSGRSGLEGAANCLSDLRERLGAIGGPLAMSWMHSSIPIHLAYAELAAGRNAAVIETMTPLALIGNGTALWYKGVALVREGDLESGIDSLEKARRAFYAEKRAEGRATLIVSLGDAYRLTNRHGDAKEAYLDAIKQPGHMDNRSARATAIQRLATLYSGSNKSREIYLA